MRQRVENVNRQVILGEQDNPITLLDFAWGAGLVPPERRIGHLSPLRTAGHRLLTPLTPLFSLPRSFGPLFPQSLPLSRSRRPRRRPQFPPNRLITNLFPTQNFFYQVCMQLPASGAYWIQMQTSETSIPPGGSSPAWLEPRVSATQAQLKRPSAALATGARPTPAAAERGRRKKENENPAPKGVHFDANPFIINKPISKFKPNLVQFGSFWSP
jgi:hypothetical protein